MGTCQDRAAPEVLVLTGVCLPLSSLSVPLLPQRTAVRTLAHPTARCSTPRGPAGRPIGFDSRLEAECGTRPVALVVDDLQRADAATLDMLMWVLAGLVNRPMVVLGTRSAGSG